MFAILRGKKIRNFLLFLLDSVEILSMAHPILIEYPAAFHEGRCVVDADLERPFIPGVVGVNSWARTVDYILIFGVKPILRRNSPSVQFEASAAQVSCRVVIQGY